MEEPRFLLGKESICYGCNYYKHYTESNDPNYWFDRMEDVDENGGVCDCGIPCFAGSLNDYKENN